NLGKGVKVEVGERECTIDLFMIVRYGVRIPQVAERVQDNVKRAVETMTGLRVRSVNIHIQGVAFPEAQREAEARAK
ncbi:MAG: Asp23/Gls24 family envelope stress response protein, partial [Bacillota bacterium]